MDNAPPITSLPQEMIARIVNHVESPSDFRNLTSVCAATRLYANMRIWQVCDTEKLQELASYPSPEQQQFANFIQTLDWNILSGDRCYFDHLQFPSLERLFVHLCENGPFLLPGLNQFIQPQLKHFLVEDHEKDLARITSNYIPLLANCPDLRTLEIEIHPRASGAEFLTALTACQQLEIFNLTGSVCEVLDSRIFQYLACQSRLKSFSYIAAGLRLTLDLIQPTLATLAPGQTIFNNLTTLKTGMDGAAAEELFPRMPTIRSLTLYVDQSDDIIDWLGCLPRLETLVLIARARVSLTTHYLSGLQNLHLTYLQIGGEGALQFNGITITPNDIDTLFGSHASLQYLNVSWRGDNANNSFLQHRPRLLMERVLANYPVLRSLEMPAPCGPVYLQRLPAASLNSNVRYLDVASVVPPRANRNTHPVA